MWVMQELVQAVPGSTVAGASCPSSPPCTPDSPLSAPIPGAACLPAACLLAYREVALEEFEDFSNVQDSVFVRIANIPLQESIRDLR